MRKAGIYIHIPFCKVKCNYCNFYSVPHMPDVEERYVSELVNEINKKDKYRGITADTVYIGGGTPGLLSLKSLSRIVNALEKAFVFKPEEFTIELNPCSSSNLLYYKDYGINRISMGVQSLDNSILRRLGRLHDAGTALIALETAAAHYKNVSADIIAGTADGQDLASDIREIKDFVKHFSVYMLKIEDGTPLARLKSCGEYSEAGEDETVNQYNDAVSELKKNGFNRYEISNFALEGFESRHNLKYWLMEDYIGFGAAAHSFLSGKRYFNPDDIKLYLAGEHSGNGLEREETADAVFEEIMLALRLERGLDINNFNAKYQKDFYSEYGKKVEQLKSYLDITPERLKIKEEYLLLENSILKMLLF